MCNCFSTLHSSSFGVVNSYFVWAELLSLCEAETCTNWTSLTLNIVFFSPPKFQRFNLLCSDVMVYSRVCQYTVTSPWHHCGEWLQMHTSDYAQPHPEHVTQTGHLSLKLCCCVARSTCSGRFGPLWHLNLASIQSGESFWVTVTVVFSCCTWIKTMANSR